MTPPPRQALKPVSEAKRLYVLGDSSTQFLVKAIRKAAHRASLELEVQEGEYGQIPLNVGAADSDLYTARPDQVLLYFSTPSLLNEFYSSPPEARAAFAEAWLARVMGYVETICSRLETTVYLTNLNEVTDMVFEGYGGKTDTSIIYQLRKINLGLMQLAQRHDRVQLLDVAALYNRYGRDACSDPRLLVHADFAFSLDFFTHMAENLVRMLSAARGTFIKCVICDLDNTIWGGVVGDDGWEGIQVGELGIGKAFTLMQLWLRELKRRGIILAVCSKNEASIAREAFERNPEMILQADDFAVFVANWKTKVDNIRYIQSVLNIGFDSMVFLDDSPFEREMVRKAIPEITVPELPQDPTLYLAALADCHLMDTATWTGSDEKRIRHYQEEARRSEVRESFETEGDFLRSLEMKATIEPVTPYNAPRVAQLTQRSNQFNLRTVRYSEAEVKAIGASDRHRSFVISLRDRFGDYGVISLVFLEHRGDECFIDTWIMSCRVLKRTVEVFVLNAVASAAKEIGAQRLVGEYLPTRKNGLVKDHYPKLGFLPGNADKWEMDLNGFEPHDTYIKND